MGVIIKSIGKFPEWNHCKSLKVINDVTIKVYGEISLLLTSFWLNKEFNLYLLKEKFSFGLYISPHHQGMCGSPPSKCGISGPPRVNLPPPQLVCVCGGGGAYHDDVCFVMYYFMSPPTHVKILITQLHLGELRELVMIPFISKLA